MFQRRITLRHFNILLNVRGPKPEIYQLAMISIKVSCEHIIYVYNVIVYITLTKNVLDETYIS